MENVLPIRHAEAYQFLFEASAVMTIKELSKRERAALLAVKREIARRYPLRWMKLFGSKARGDADAESDLDVAIVIEELDWEIEKSVYEICFYAGLEHDALISPVVYSGRELSQSRTRSTPFFKNLEREGLPI